MAANADVGVDDFDDLPIDGRDAWIGYFLLLGSAVMSLKFLSWIAITLTEVVMR